MRRLHQTLVVLHSAADIAPALQEICAALVELLGCRRALFSLVDGEEMRTAAFAGAAADGHRILSDRCLVRDWEPQAETGERRGMLRFVTDPDGSLDSRNEHSTPATTLVAPMVVAEGCLVGLLVLDFDPGAPLPDELTCTVLEMFAVQAGVALQHHHLAEIAADEHVELKRSEERFRAAFDRAPIGMVEVLEDSGRMVIAGINEATATMFGLGSAVWARDRLVDEVLPTVGAESLGASLRRLRRGQRSTGRLEAKFRRTDGTEIWGLVEVAPIPSVSGRAGILCQIVDLSKAKAAERELTLRANLDPLTGLPNRRVVLNRLEEVVIEAGESGRTGAVLFCDLDHFKSVNDAHGHLVGDQVLAALATRLASVVRRSDLVGRVGGDELVIVAYPISERAADELVDRVSEAFGSSLVLGGVAVRVGISVGTALITGSDDVAEVLRRADAAMYAGRLRRAPASLGEDTA